MMDLQPTGLLRQDTSKIEADELWDLQLSKTDVTYRVVPHTADVTQRMPTWRVRLDLIYDLRRRLGLDVNGEAVLGRGEDSPELVSLDLFEAGDLGVSRRHLMLRPTEAKLYAIDLESTNGTRINGRSIGVNTPYSLSNGDILALGQLEFVVRIIKQPRSKAARVTNGDLADLFTPLVKTITSQLTIDEVLKQALHMTVSLTDVDEASIWLVDEQTGELFLEAEQGIENEQVRHMRLSVADTLAGKVIETGQVMRASRKAGGARIKVKTGYLVEAVVYVPLTLAGVTFGVLLAAHRADGKRITAREEKIAMTIADFTAVAVQNARLYEATCHALTRRNKVMMALSYALSYDFKSIVNAIIGYAGLLPIYTELDSESSEMVGQVGSAASRLAQLVDQLIEITALSGELTLHLSSCDLVDLVGRAVADMYNTAAAKSTTLDFQVIGNPYMIQGDATHLYRSVLNLIDNAIRYSPPGAQVYITAAFLSTETLIRVRDTGPGILEEDLPVLFDQYFRGKQSESGIGLGLEMVRATAEAHRGAVVAHNGEGGGAEFIITLPGTLRVP
jgi:signal transduction histidine kinase